MYRYVRIGIAFAPARQGRRDEYEILILDGSWDEKRYARYVGYREQRKDGEAMVGLPLAGKYASWNQPLLDFNPADYQEVRWFAEKVMVAD